MVRPSSNLFDLILTISFVYAAYSDVMRIMLIVATVMSVFPIILALFMPNFYLGDKQNAVVAEDLAGQIGESEGHATQTSEREGKTSV